MLLIGREERQGVYIGRGVRLTVTGVAPGRRYARGAEDPDSGRAELTIEHDAAVIVSGPDVEAGEHVRLQIEAEVRGASLEVAGSEPARVTRLWLERRASVLIGRGVRVIVVEVQADGMVRLGFEAPKHVAVSRDDFTLEDHLRFQVKREAGAR
jgi:sRNA-binding carbon storage regulator CsrA